MRVSVETMDIVEQMRTADRQRASSRVDTKLHE